MKKVQRQCVAISYTNYNFTAHNSANLLPDCLGKCFTRSVGQAVLSILHVC